MDLKKSDKEIMTALKALLDLYRLEVALNHTIKYPKIPYGVHKKSVKQVLKDFKHFPDFLKGWDGTYKQIPGKGGKIDNF